MNGYLMQNDNSKATLPNFLIVGAQRTGTTWLFECLRSHPEIYLADIKEVNFFSSTGAFNYDRGLDWYAAHFSSAGNYTAIGEITPEYLLDAKAPERIKETLGNVKIIIIIRNPIERAYSSYGKGLRENHWSCSFEQFIEANLDYCIDRGMYYTQIERYLRVFPKQNICVKIYKDIAKDPCKYIQGIYSFLGVNSDHIPASIHQRFNVGTGEKSKLVQFLVLTRDLVYRVPLLNKSVKAIQRTSIGNQFIRQLLISKRTEISQEIASGLSVVYYDQVVQLSKLLNRDLIEEWNLEPVSRI
ncbi:MAG: sulfotransferase domain-containing protein [Planctomycetes bacterium]|nr:sulfotransferase domain-containing protein [Planctomycetota bacterium]